MGRANSRLLLAVLATVLLAIFITGCGRDTVAKVNGQKITRQEYYDRLERLPYRDPMNGRQMESGAWVLDRLVTEKLILGMAEKEKIAPTDEQIEERVANAQKQSGFAAKLKEAGFTKEQFKDLMRVEQAAFNLQTKGVKVTKEEINSYYEENKKTRFTDPEQASVAAIFVKDKADADKAMGLLDKNVEFGIVSSRLSSSPELAAQGGKLKEPIVRGDRRVPEAIQNIILSTAKNKYTKPIPGDQGGFVIFKVLSHVPEKTKKLREVEFNIRQQIMVQKGVEKKNINVEEQLGKYRESAKIVIDIDRYAKMLQPTKQAKP